MRRNRWLRVLTLSWAALQLLAPALASAAEGVLERRDGGSSSHVEAATLASCPVAHSPQCGVCRYLSLAQAPAPSPADVAVVQRAAPTLCFERVADRIAGSAHPPVRGPPRV